MPSHLGPPLRTRSDASQGVHLPPPPFAEHSKAVSSGPQMHAGHHVLKGLGDWRIRTRVNFGASCRAGCRNKSLQIESGCPVLSKGVQAKCLWGGYAAQAVATVAIYSSTLVDQVYGYSVTAAVIPHRLLLIPPSGNLPTPAPRTVREVAQELELKVELELSPGAEYLAVAIAALVIAGDKGDEAVNQFQELSKSPGAWNNLDPSVRAFAYECASTPLIAVEESPIGKAEMVAVVGLTGTVCLATGGGALVVLVVAAGSIIVLSSTVVFAHVAMERLDGWLRRRWA